MIGCEDTFVTIVDDVVNREETYSITAEGFVRDDNADLRKDVDDHIDEAELRYSFLNRARELAGYALYKAFEFEDGNVLYLSGVQISSRYQGRGMTKAINNHVIEQHDPDYFAFRTQSIRMYKSGSDSVAQLYPKFNDPFIPEDVARVGDQLAKKIGGEFPVSKAYYGGSALYGERPTHEEDKIFYSEIDFHNGDAVLCVGVPKNRLTQE